MLKGQKQLTSEEIRTMPDYSILPLAIILGFKGHEYSIERAKLILRNEPNVRVALKSMDDVEE